METETGIIERKHVRCPKYIAGVAIELPTDSQRFQVHRLVAPLFRVSAGAVRQRDVTVVVRLSPNELHVPKTIGPSRFFDQLILWAIFLTYDMSKGVP